MKKLLLAALVGLLPTAAPGADETEKSAAARILDATNFTDNGFESARAAFKPVIDQFRRQGLAAEAIEEIEIAADAFFHKVMSDPTLRTEAIRLYKENFTNEELEELLAFYETPLGQKTLVRLPQIMQSSLTLGQKIADKHAPSFQEELTRIMQKYAAAVPNEGEDPIPPEPAPDPTAVPAHP